MGTAVPLGVCPGDSQCLCDLPDVSSGDLAQVHERLASEVTCGRIAA
ncbi:hypothetical protein [Streptomyces nitrosporeus]|nr:hypothetical protein [Streptomyces nitrosporeus]